MTRTRRFITFLIVLLLLLQTTTWFYNRPYHRNIPNLGSITVYHRNYADFDAYYVIVTRIRSKLIVERIIGTGPENVIRLEDEEAQAYLDKYLGG